ncbi:hypothetical protein PQR62_22380 [Herbaspirillum lusitanum]|uniref:Uncharacterized protein n=1 Tax=Herbaspirillum lusitanum TaxID=213312 RepID=A0ABW9AEP0_9BURK
MQGNSNKRNSSKNQGDIHRRASMPSPPIKKATRQQARKEALHRQPDPFQPPHAILKQQPSGNTKGDATHARPFIHLNTLLQLQPSMAECRA